MSCPIIFHEPDSQAALEAWARAMQPIPPGVPVIALAFKVVQSPDGEEELVNYEFTDPDLLRSLALVLSVSKSELPNPSKES